MLLVIPVQYRHTLPQLIVVKMITFLLATQHARDMGICLVVVNAVQTFFCLSCHQAAPKPPAGCFAFVQ